MESFFALLSFVHPLDEELKSAIEKEVIVLTLPKDYFLVEAPRASDHVYFLKSGFACAYYFEQGKKVVSSLCKSGQFVVTHESISRSTGGHEYIQLMESSEVICISHERLDYLLNHYSPLQLLYRKLLERCVVIAMKRAREMNRYTARVRLEKLLRVFPRLEELLSQESIASYLGIRAQSLSRIRRTKA